MYLIRDKSNRYLKRSADSKITFTNSESLADVFPSVREANDYIRKAFTKKNRKFYKAVWRDTDSLSKPILNQPSGAEETSDGYTQSIEIFDESISTYLNPEIEKFYQKLQVYDGMILDIRHWLRDENTRLNVCQGYQVAKRLQDIERDRAECKKELQRVTLLRGAVQKACQDSESFEYDDYKNRQIEDVRAFIFTEPYNKL